MFPFSDVNQEKIVEEGGLDALLTLMQSSQNSTILRVASGAIANLAMNGNFEGFLLYYVARYPCLIAKYLIIFLPCQFFGYDLP